MFANNDSSDQYDNNKQKEKKEYQTYSGFLITY